MREFFPEEVEMGRVLHGAYGSEENAHHGAFHLRMTKGGDRIFVIVDDGETWQASGLAGPAWEHVSVSLYNRCPTWQEMCWVKDLFWSENECVVQYHPAKAQYVNRHDNCLHLWRLKDAEFPLPPVACV